LGLVFHTGTIHMPHLHNYWKSNPLSKVECFSSHMCMNHFLCTL
jgi:hypothetical protein